MKMLNYWLVAGLSILFFVSCSDSSSKNSISGDPTTISGKIIDGGNQYIGLYRISLKGQKSLVMSTQADSRGNFSMTSDKPIPQAIYQFTVGNKGTSFVLNGKDTDIKINGDFKKLETYDFELSGSQETSLQIIAFYNMINDKWPKDQIVQYMNETENSLIAIQTGIAFMMKSPEDYAHVRKLVNKVDADLKGSPYVDEFKEFVDFYDEKASQASNSDQFAIKVGEPAPEIALPNPDGEIMRLSDLKGKVVLLDFWASWCAPCRRANPSVVSIYNKYKDDGFTVFSVSLDRNGQKDRWVNAIKQDNLSWANHVSDLKFWQSEPARRYGITAIPATFLLDRNGIIRALNPRSNLEEAIQELL